jgi:O-antigen ligase
MHFLNSNHNYIKKILFFLVCIFPLSIVLRSAAINLNLIFISIIFIIIAINKKDNQIFKNFFIKFIFIFFSFILFNSFLNFYSIEIIIKSLGNFRYILLTCAVYFTLSNISKKYYFIFVRLNFILIILISLDIIFQYIFNQNIIGFLPGMCAKNYENCTRFSGIFGSELIAGAFLTQIGMLIFFLLINENLDTKYGNKNMKSIYLIFLFFIILLTGERNALIVFLICLFFNYFFQRLILPFIILITIFTALLVLASQYSTSIKMRYINLFDGLSLKKELSIKKKIIETPWSFHYQAAYELFLDKPVFGHGLKSFRVKCKETKIDQKTVDERVKFRTFRACATHPHSYAMEFLSEHGIVGFMLYIFLLIIIFNELFKLRKYSLNKNVITAIGIGSLLLSVLFPLKPSGSFFTTFNASILFYILGFFIFYLSKAKLSAK